MPLVGALLYVRVHKSSINVTFFDTFITLEFLSERPVHLFAVIRQRLLKQHPSHLLHHPASAKYGKPFAIFIHHH